MPMERRLRSAAPRMALGFMSRHSYMTGCSAAIDPRISHIWLQGRGLWAIIGQLVSIEGKAGQVHDLSALPDGKRRKLFELLEVRLFLRLSPRR